jgi:peroxiredoxin (alkyl hydroperoxide reductase subunit C)
LKTYLLKETCIKTGEKFPHLEVKTTHGDIDLPDKYKGKWFILFSHPGDFTPVCTMEIVAFAKKYENLQELNSDLIELSFDSNIIHMSGSSG